MVKINEYERTANFAWSHDSLPLLVSGSAAGAVDLDFSSSSSLEIFDIFKTGKDAIVETPLETKIYGLDWSKPTSSAPRGTIAGALENGILQLWDAQKLLNGSNSETATSLKGTKHTGAVKTVQFNPTQDNVLASAGAKGEIFIWDTNKFEEATSPGKAMTPMEDVTCLSWNNNVKHVFASAGSTGYTSIWDLRAKKEVLHLTYTGVTGRCNLSVVSWNPAESTQLLTASDSDNAPLILSWNLRNPKEPEKILEGHKKGILSLDWCKQDNELLLTCGKDNSTILWDPIHGVKLGEYPTTANWVFETRFAPTLPDVFATSSFDGKIVVQSLQDTSPPVTTSVAEEESTDNTNTEDFWGNLASKETQQPEFTVKKAPKWLKRPTSVSFAFGGKIVQVTQPIATESKSVVSVTKFKGDSSLAADVKALSKSIDSKDFKAIVDDKVNQSQDATRADWELLQKLLSTDKLQLLKEQITVKVEEEATKEATDNAEVPAAKETDGFFDKLGKEQDLLFEPPTGDFELFSKSDSKVETDLKKLVLAGKFEDAVDLCIEEDRLVEASILALDGTEALKQKVKNAYFTKAIPTSTFARVLYNVSSSDVTDLVTHGDITNWKEIASGISTFHKDSQSFNTKISELGDRILASDLATSRNDALICYAAGGSIDKISAIWLKEVADVEKSLLTSDVSITASDAHFKALHEFVEKITVYRAVSNISGEFSGPGIEKLCKAVLEYSNIISNLGEFDLANGFLALLPSSNEQLKIEKDRVSKASSKKPVAANTTGRAGTSFHTTTTAAKKSSFAKPSPYAAAGAFTATSPALQTPPTLSSTTSYTPVGNGYTPAGANNPYAAVAASAAAAAPGYATAATPSNNPYAPATALDSLRKPSFDTGANGGYQSTATIPPPPPPKVIGANAKDAGGWNDLPVHLGVVNSRSTASPSPYASLAANAAAAQQQQVRPEPISRLSSYGAVPTAGPPPPPPPAAQQAQAAQVPASSLSAVASPKTPHPTPAAPKPSKYAPPPSLTPAASEANGISPQQQQQVPPPLQQAVPPPPPSNPYAPKSQPASNLYAPAAPTQQQQPSANGSYAPPPSSFGQPPPPSRLGSYGSPHQAGNAYAAPPPPSAPSGNGYAGAAPPPPPAAAYQQQQQQQQQQPVVPAKQRHPAGDRSHIPASQAPIFEILGSTLQQTASKMPEKYHKQVADTEKRLNILYDHLNNEDFGQEIVDKLLEVVKSVQAGDLVSAGALQSQVALDHPVECGQWAVGLKRLIQMTEAANR